MNHAYYIGLDVHKETVAVAWAGPEGQPQFHGNCASSLRTDAVDDMQRAKRRMSSFLLRNGHHYTGKGKWGTAHLK